MPFRYNKNGVLPPKPFVNFRDRRVWLPLFPVHDEQIFVPPLRERDDNVPDTVIIGSGQPVLMNVQALKVPAIATLRASGAYKVKETPSFVSSGPRCFGPQADMSEQKHRIYSWTGAVSWLL